MKENRSEPKKYRLKYKRKEPLDTEGLARVLIEMASELPSDYQVEFIEKAEAIIKNLESQEERAA